MAGKGFILCWLAKNNNYIRSRTIKNWVIDNGVSERDLHLAVSIRSFRSEQLSNFIHELLEINFESAKIAKEAALKYSKITPKKPRFVAGSIGPTNKTLSLSPDVNDPGFREIDFDYLKKYRL
mgnify:CR=1 FL=1